MNDPTSRPPTLDDLDAGVCFGCGARIRWAFTENARRIPLDDVTVDDGNVELEENLFSGQPIALVRGDGGRPYRSHFATCPKAAEFRRTGQAVPR